MGLFAWSESNVTHTHRMAILSGCDYLESIPGLGLKTAHRLMRRYKTAEKVARDTEDIACISILTLASQVIQFIRLEGQLKVSRDYEDQFKRAELTFLHQRVFCPTSKKLVYLEDLPESVSARLSSPQAEELRFIGPFLEDDIACAIARGDLCPLSQAKMVDIAPDSEQLKAYYKPSTNVAKGTIKDFFGPSTASCKVVTKPKKRGALGEISGNNLFSNKITEPPEHPKPATKAVKSRFFAPFDKSVPRKRDIVTIADSGDEEPRGPQQALDRQTTGSGDERSDLITAEIASKEPPADIDPDAPIAVSQTLVYTPSRDDVGESVAPGALPTIHTGERPKVTSDVILPPMPKPDPPVAPQHEEVPCGLWDPDTVSSPSCPGDSPRLRKLRRYVSPPVPSHRRRGSNREMDNVIEDCELLTSPVTDGSPAVIPRPAPIESAVQSASPGGLTDLTDLSSPRFNVRAGEHLESHRKGDRHCGDGTHESEDSLWSDEAVTPNTSFQSGGITDATPRTSKRRRDSASRLHRSNAVVIITDAKAYPEDKPSVEDRAADFDKRVTSVIAGWRQKFAPTSSRKIRKKPASPLVSSQNREAQRLLSPIRSRKQISYSDGLISSPDIVHSPPVFNAKAAEDTGYRNAALRTNDKTDKSRRSLSESTARALEAFRFKPV